MIIKERKKLDRTGEIYETKNGQIIITKYFDKNNVSIKFLEDNTELSNIQFGHISRGTVKNPNKPNIFNLGFNGIGKYSNKTHPKIYNTWSNMFKRCYLDITQQKQKTYIGCSVDKRWFNLQIFGEWYEKNYIDNWQLDKDILLSGNKIYGPDTCCFIPAEINTIFCNAKLIRGELPVGVSLHGNKYRVKMAKNTIQINYGVFSTIEEAFSIYKIEKEKHIKFVTNKYKDLLSLKVYNILINYEIKITD